MGYINKNLLNGENVVYQAKLHKIIFIWPVVFLLSSIPFFVVGKQETMFVGGVLLFFSVLACFNPLLDYLTSEFGITNKRVMVKVGFIRRTSLEVMLAKVEGIQVDQGILGRILNFGSIVVSGTGGTKDPYHKISSPFEFRKKVLEQIILEQDSK